MASIRKRRNSYCVVYWYEDEHGNKHQRWETFRTNGEAKKRKAEVELQIEEGTLIVAEAKTVHDLMEEYMSLYGVNSWAMSTYEAKRNLYFNYIDPLIGSMELKDVNTRVMDKFYQSLLRVRSKVVNNRKPNNEYLSCHVIREIHKLMRSCFNQAVKWELMNKNPCDHATLPKEEHTKREIWDMETLEKALTLCDDDILKLSLNLAFACSLRVGELLALTWDCVEISESAISAGNAYVFINKELQRVNREALSFLNEKDVLFQFPTILGKTTTALVLKTPKTVSSIRKVFLPRTVAEMLVERKREIEEQKELFGDEFIDYNLVFCTPNGRPMESNTINKLFNDLIKEHNLPKVVFHSLRHSSVTYKLKLSGGDIKMVQGDSGHAQATMVTERYAHILDEDRRVNAQRLEESFYQKKADSAADAKETAVQPPAAPEDNLALITKLLSDPKTAGLLKALVSNM